MKKVISIVLSITVLFSTMGFQMIHHHCAACGGDRYELLLISSETEEQPIHHACCSSHQGIENTSDEGSCSESDCCPSEFYQLNPLVDSQPNLKIKVRFEMIENSLDVEPMGTYRIYEAGFASHLIDRSLHPPNISSKTLPLIAVARC